MGYFVDADGVRKNSGNGRPSPRHAAKLTDEQRDFAEKHLDLCSLKAKKFHKRCPFISEADFYQAAFEGLADAVKGYDGRPKSKFESFADLRIVGAILDMMRGQGLVKIPRRNRDEMIRYISLDWRDEYQMGGHHAFVPPDNTPPAEANLESDDNIRFWLRGFTAAEKFIITEYLLHDRMTMKQVGYHLDLSESRVSQMYAKIIQDLRKRARDPRFRELATA